MAGAGKKTFVAGEVLTAAQVNDYLMDQAVMRFSGSAARAASITAPSEGMVTYLDDSNVLEYYDGSAWVEVVPQAQIDGKIAASLFTASAQVLIGTGSSSALAISPGVDGQVLSIDTTASLGVAWKTPSSGGDATYLEVAATGVTALPSTLGAGFYQIQTSTSTSWTNEQWRFMDADENLYGATITSGAGFFTIPVDAASLNITAGSFPFTVLIQEIKGVTDTLLDPPIVDNFTWTEINAGTVELTTASAAASVGVFNVKTGKFINLGATASSNTGASIVSGASIGDIYDVVAVQSNPTGVWSTASVTASTRYPFVVFSGNDTYVPPPWSTTADVLVVSGGGGSRPGTPTTTGGGGGGAGGARIFTNVPTTGSVAVTVGAGGAAATSGTGSSFGPSSTTGGGAAGQENPAVAGSPGGSGGGGSAGGSGIPGEGYPGGVGAVAAPYLRTGGGGGGVAGAGGNGGGGGGAGGSGSVMYGVLVSVGGDGMPTPVGSTNPAPGSGGNGGSGPSNSAAPGRAGMVIVKANE